MVYSSIQQRVRKRKFLRLVRKYRLHIAAVAILFLISMIVATAFAWSTASDVNDLPKKEPLGAALIAPNGEGEATPAVVLTDYSSSKSFGEMGAEPEITLVPNEEDVVMLARLIWGEARGVPSVEQKAAVVWCVLNRVDSGKYPDTIAEVVTQKSQFCGYSESFPATDEFMEIAEDVLIRWYQEKAGIKDVGRVLPSEYLFFVGDGVRNYFSVEWRSSEYYDWSLPSPYAD